MRAPPRARPRRGCPRSASGAICMYSRRRVRMTSTSISSPASGTRSSGMITSGLSATNHRVSHCSGKFRDGVGLALQFEAEGLLGNLHAVDGCRDVVNGGQPEAAVPGQLHRHGDPLGVPADVGVLEQGIVSCHGFPYLTVSTRVAWESDAFGSTVSSMACRISVCCFLTRSIGSDSPRSANAWPSHSLDR